MKSKNIPSVLKFLKYTILILAILLFSVSIVYFQKDIPLAQITAKYADKDSKFTELMGMQVHYKDEGDKNDSIPLVLIHGTSSSLFTWNSSVNILKKEHRIIRLDLPAFALTGPSPERNYSMEYYCRFIDSFLSRLQIKHCLLAGNSLGGGIAWYYTFLHPDKVNKLILVDASGYTTSTKVKGSLAFTLAKIPILNNILKWITPKSIVKKSLEDAYGDKSKVTDHLVTLYYEMALRKGNRQALIDRMQSGFQMESNLIKQIKTPTLIIWGDQDQLISVTSAYLFNKDIQNSQLEIYKGVGHVPMEEEPIRFARSVNLFLK